MKRTRETTIKSSDTQTESLKPRNNSSSNIDNKLESISKVLEESSNEWAQTSQKGVSSIFGGIYSHYG
jgi:flagellar biosynthesis chaperone FliJ